jgi:hypothetical protein
MLGAPAPDERNQVRRLKRWYGLQQTFLMQRTWFRSSETGGDACGPSIPAQTCQITVPCGVLHYES